jgi:hypothetical protein
MLDITGSYCPAKEKYTCKCRGQPKNNCVITGINHRVHILLCLSNFSFCGPPAVLPASRKFGRITPKEPSKKDERQEKTADDLGLYFTKGPIRGQIMKQFCWLYFSFKNALKKLIFTDFDTETVENGPILKKKIEQMLVLQRGRVFFSQQEFFGQCAADFFAKPPIVLY